MLDCTTCLNFPHFPGSAQDRHAPAGSQRVPVSCKPGPKELIHGREGHVQHHDSIPGEGSSSARDPRHHGPAGTVRPPGALQAGGLSLCHVTCLLQALQIDTKDINPMLAWSDLLPTKLPFTVFAENGHSGFSVSGLDTLIESESLAKSDQQSCLKTQQQQLISRVVH